MSKFVDAPTLNRKNISRLLNKFHQPGARNNLPHHRKHTALTLETLTMVSNTLSKTPNKSLPRVAKEQSVSYGTVHSATHALQFHPYHIRITYELLLLDPDQHLHYPNWLLTNFIPVPMQPTFLNDFFFSDEVWCSLSGYVDSQSKCYWVADNPLVHLEAPLHLEKIGIWNSLSGTKIIRPLSFTTTIAGEVHLNIIEQLVALLEETDHYCWFQQDNTHPHVARDTMAVLKSFSMTVLFHVVRGLLGFPDQSPLDYLRGYLEDECIHQRQQLLSTWRRI